MERELSDTRNARKHREKRKRLRAELLQLLGGKCRNCGEDNPDLLEPHHTEPRTWKSADVWALKRLRIYLQEAREGKVQLLCGPCNKMFGPPGDNEPF